MYPVKVRTEQEVSNVFGNFRDKGFEEKHMTLETLPGEHFKDGKDRRVFMNKALVDPLKTAFKAMFKDGLKIDTFDGCYFVRPVRGASSGKMSTHSWGISVDINADTNKLGTHGNMDPRIVLAFESAGFFWGGRWDLRPDPQHFQLCVGY